MKRFCGHAHTMYSNIRLIDCINKPKDLILKAAELGLSGIALTDHETLGGHVQWLKIEKELKESKQIPENFKCALGNEIYLVEDRHNIERYWHYILIAKNTEGHKALRELSSIAWLNGFSSKGMMRVPTEMKELENIVHKYPNSLIASQACFSKGAQVLVSNGYKNIEDITSEDFVLNRYGEWEKVNYPTSRWYEGIGYEIKMVGGGEIKCCTENHRFLTTTEKKIQQYEKCSKKEGLLSWKPAKHLLTKNEGEEDILLFPIKDQYTLSEEMIKKDERQYELFKYEGTLYKKVFIEEKIKKEICEKVYCLNNNTHSFVCEGVIVHNCLGSYLSDRIVKLANAEENQESEEKIYEIKSQIHKFIQWNLDLFGDDFYFEIAAGRSEEQIKLNQRIKPIVKAYGGKLVIGDDAHYLTAQDRQAHKIYLNSKNGDREVDAFYAYSHLMTNEEAYQNLSDIFSESEFQEMCQNSLDMQNKIGTYDIFHSPIIPHVEVKEYAKKKATPEIARYHTLSSLVESNNDQERYWVNQCLQSLRDKNLWSDQYLARVEEEARIIKTVGNKLNNCLFEYFNTFQHYIDLFWECGSIVGPGRGSSVCFLTNYLLGITQLDPIKWHLKEWRFLNDDRLELPDIDIDLNPTKRNKIFQEIRKERGELNLIQVCTWGTECTRSAIAAACRGYRSEECPLGISPDEASYISSLVPIERGNLWEIKDCILGNESKGRRPVLEMVNALAKYPGLFEGICAIEGLVNKRGIHASGVMLYNNSFLDTNALMRSPNGDITTQFDLHDSEALGDTKFDFLATEICDKITLCIQMLQQDKLLDPNKSLHEIYYTHFHPEVINVKEPRLWEALGRGEVLDVFQFSTGVGLSAAKRIKPKNPTELTSANALMRLMGEEGAEKPIDRYCRLKDDMSMWYQEATIAGLTPEEIKILEPYYLPNYGVPCAQEDLMEVCMDPNIAHFTLSEANHARKVVAKKKVDEVESLKEKFISQCPRREFGEYVWKTVAGPQMGYSFSTPHALAYSFVGIITLYLGVIFPSVYWNCACLIVNSGSTELLTSDEKGTANTPNYGKISIALARSQQKGICIHLPDINKSGVTFEPEVQSNAIRYGIKGINSIGDDYVRLIMSKRPYSSINDFCEKTGLGKTQMISLVKSGAFDSLCQGDRNKAMQEYLNILFPTKPKITFAQLNMLISYNLIPESKDWYKRVFNFNKYLKNHRYKNYYELDSISAPFYFKYFDSEQIVYADGRELLISTEWEKNYKRAMEEFKGWISINQALLASQLADKMKNEFLEKYAPGDISTWEMNAVGLYCHQHELANFNQEKYGVVNFKTLPAEPSVEMMINSKWEKSYQCYKLSRICGTIINRDRTKNFITILEPTMEIVNVKINKEQFAQWDRQISEKKSDGTRRIVEKSFFERGTKIMISGMRRNDDFIAKVYKKTPYPMFEKILSLNEDGDITQSTSERARGDD